MANNQVVEQPLARTPVPPLQLFDLSKDPSESKNVLEQNPAIGEQLKSQLAALIAAGRSRQ
jgi:hypothetical protein